MKKLYTNENRFLVWNAKNILEDAGFSCTIRNEFASSGVGDLSPIDSWPELWCVNDWDYDRAQNLLMQVFTSNCSAQPWKCRSCLEANEPAFELCWNCGQDSGESPLV